MSALLPLVPLLWIPFALFALRQAPLPAALTALLLALILWLCGIAAPPSLPLAARILTDSILLFASIAAVMIPGLLLVILLENSGANRALANSVQAAALKGHHFVSLIFLGLSPLLESMTGFGISLIAIVPVLLARFPRENALRIALASMVIMPWGTLGLATSTAATMLRLDAAQLASLTALCSAPVFIFLSCLVLWLSGERRPLSFLIIFARALLFVSLLYVSSRYLGPAMAGIAAGLIMILLELPGKRIPWPRAAWPYLLLTASVIVLKWLSPLASHIVLHGTHIHWQPFSSPGLPLALVCLVLLGTQYDNTLLRPWWQRARRPLLTLLAFLLLSQVMVQTDMLHILAALLGNSQGPSLILLTILLGALAGYLTGSNVGGNVLVMPALANLTHPALAALMNSAVAHAALGSLPMIAILAGLGKLTPAEEQRLARFALYLVGINILLLILAALLWPRGKII